MNLLASRIELFSHHAQALLLKLELPSKDEYFAAASDALHDVRIATSSLWNLAYLTFRPIVILLGILSHHLTIILRIVAKHSIAHGWVAAKEGFFQLRTATFWCINFQRNLSQTAKYAEAGTVLLLIVLWLLRRHVQKNRYVERIFSWYNDKKRRLIIRYHRTVDQIAKTSLFLALLLPHLLYIIFVVCVKQVIPGVVTYLATKTYLNSLISFWHPLYLTISVLSKLSDHLCQYEKYGEADGKRENEAKSGEKTRGDKSKVELMTPSKIKQQEYQKAEMEEIKKQAVHLLKYWTVLAIILAILRTFQLFPLFGRIFDVTDLATELGAESIPRSKNAWARRFSRRGEPNVLSKLRLSGRFVEEIRLLFFLWLRVMPLVFALEEMSNSHGMTPGGQCRNREKSATGDFGSSRPVDILYSKLSPLAASVINSSSFLTKSLTNSEKEGLLSKIIQKLRSVLELAIMLRLCRESTKDWIIRTIVESYALLPASVTLLMPSYFTSYGVIYVSLVVPAGYSVESCTIVCNDFFSSEKNVAGMREASRYLQFWVVHAILSTTLHSFAPVLSWIPLSTHAIWLLWAYVQMDFPTRIIYSSIVSEMSAFGLVKSSVNDSSRNGNEGTKSIENTALVRSVRRIISILPSNVQSHANEVEPASSVKVAATEQSNGSEDVKDAKTPPTEKSIVKNVKNHTLSGRSSNASSSKTSSESND